MKISRQIVILAELLFLVITPWVWATAEEPVATSTEINSSTSSIDPAVLGGPAAASGLERGTQLQRPDPCRSGEIVAGPSRPYWDSGAATTPCGNLETDFGLVLQPMGGGVSQRLVVSSVRYGLTPRLDLRWGVTNHIAQSGAEMEPVEGLGDASVSATYRFHEQGRWSPAMALSYGVVLPEADPEKEFGSGFVDHQFLFIASRDLGSVHVDFNAVGALDGEEQGHDGAVQFGLALTRPVTRRLSWILESYGGPQPGTTDRFGAVLTGGSFIVRPWLVVDGAYSRTYTAGSPRQQILFGITWARRIRFGAIGRGSKIGRLLGR
jgi:hypothetical protein